MPYIFPISADQKDEAVQEIEDTKIQIGFDEIVARALAARQVYKRQLRWLDLEDYVARQLPLVKAKVNAMLFEVICSSNSTEFHKIQASQAVNYVPEDDVKVAVRRLIDTIYDDRTTHNRIKRQVSTGCIIAICAVVNSADFVV